MATSLDPSAVLGQLTDSYLKLPLIQKILFPLLIAGSVAGIVYVSKWANRPEFSVLFSDLEPADSAAVIERLKEQRVKYQVRGDGDTIAISPPNMVHELRIELASEGVPTSGTVGYEIFDTSELGTTTFQEKMKFIRASQGELERTITSLEAVQAARVHITQPERTVFARKSSEASASVLLKIRRGQELEKTQIRGISHLVAGSVENLSVENVSIIDDQGKLLTSPDGEDSETFEAEATRLQYQKALEKSYGQRIEQMIERVLGRNRVIARVTASLDFSMNEREEEIFDPSGQVVRSQRTIEEGQGAEVRGGIPGVVSNLDNPPNLLDPPGQTGNLRKEEVRNFEVSRAVTRVSAPRGTLERLSVAVLVDSSPLPGQAAAEGEASLVDVASEGLSAETIERIENLVKSAVGFDPARGDTVTVEAIPFRAADPALAEVFASQGVTDMLMQGLQYAAPIMLVLMFFMFLVNPFVKFLTAPSEAEVDLERLLPTGIKELEAELEAERKRANLVPEVSTAIDIEQLEELMSENSRIVKENPQQAALLIRYWLNDGRL